MGIAMLTTRLILPILLILGATPSASQGEEQDAELESAWLTFSLLTEFHLEPPSRPIARLERFLENVDASWNAAGSAVHEQILEQLNSEPEIARMVEEPKWLHGSDAVLPEWLRERPGAPNTHRNFEFERALLWIVGWDGLILHSDDHGAHWSQQESGTSAHLQAVDFIDEVNGFAVGHEGTVLRTSDGGENWVSLLGTRNDLHRSVDCLDSSNCWIAGEYPYVYRTEDGGENWEPSEELRDDDSLSVRMLTEEIGIAGGSRAIWRTEDGGQSWSRVHRVDPDLSPNSRNVIYGLATADGVNIWAVGQIEGDIGILKSEDAGKSWVNQSDAIYPPDYLDLSTLENREYHRATAVHAVSYDRAFVVATNGVILSTADGGEHWWSLQATGNPDQSFHTVVMRDGRVGWAAGNVGIVVATNSGGRSWIPVHGLISARYKKAGRLLGLDPDSITISDIEELIEDGRIGQLQSALDLVIRFREQEQGSSKLDELETRAHFELGRANKSNGDLDRAFAHYTLAIEISNEGHAAALNNRSLIFAKNGEMDSALEDIRAALEIEPEKSLYHANHCLFLRLGNDLPSAIGECELAFKVGLPGDRGNKAWVFLQRGFTRRQSGELDGAVDDFVASVQNAIPSTVERIQGMMTAAGLYSGPVDGQPNPELDQAIEHCIRIDPCFDQASEQMSDILEIL